MTSVKDNKLDPRQRRIEFGCANDRFVSLGLTLRLTLLWAYNIKPYQISGIPEWVDSSSEIFDIEAKAGRPITENDCRVMVQALLADRFKMTAHLDSREIPVYGLVIAKNGPKLQRVIDSDSDGGVKITINGAPLGPAPGAPAGLKPPVGWSMQKLADIIAGAFLDRPVVERTGLDGLYRFSLTYVTDPPGGDGPDVFTALQQQLGLRLDARKEPFQILMIDRLERPGPN